MDIQLEWSQNFEARGVLEYLQCSDTTLMFECYIVRMESTNWVFILCLNSVSGKPINVKHNQPNESLLTSITSNECRSVGLFQQGMGKPEADIILVIQQLKKDLPNVK